MQAERFKEILDGSKYENDNHDAAFLGLLIVSKYIDPKKNDIICHAGHDEICSVSIYDLCEAGITEEDVKELGKLGWHIDEDWISHFI